MIEKVRLPPIPDELTSVKYDPTTKIYQTPDGRVVVHSVRQDVEGILEFQADGSYKVHSNTGSIVEFAANNHLMYQKGGFTMTVDNNGDIRMAGHGRINIDHDAHIEVAKNASIAVNGMTDIHSTGHVKITAADFYFGATKGSIVFNSARDMEFTATKGRMTFHSSGVQTHTTDSGDFHVNTAGVLDLNSGMDTTVNAQGNMTLDTKQSMTSKSVQDNTVSAKGSVKTFSDQGTKLEGGGAIGPPTTISPVGGLSA